MTSNLNVRLPATPSCSGCVRFVQAFCTSWVLHLLSLKANYRTPLTALTCCFSSISMGFQLFHKPYCRMLIISLCEGLLVVQMFTTFVDAFALRIVVSCSFSSGSLVSKRLRHHALKGLSIPGGSLRPCTLPFNLHMCAHFILWDIHTSFPFLYDLFTSPRFCRVSRAVLLRAYTS